MPKIKICGIRSPSEAAYLNEYHVQYAGFVLYEKSRRHVTAAQAGEIMSGLSPGIKKAAVTVSPDAALIREVGERGFDILQIHGDFDETLLRNKRPDLKVWRALNVTDGHELLEFWQKAESAAADGGGGKLYDGVLIDAKNFGSGKTFGWETSRGAQAEGAAQPIAQQAVPECGQSAGSEAAVYATQPVAQSTAQNNSQGLTEQIQAFRRNLQARDISFILAGGLNAGNVAEGIELFAPDIVDTSSGVETPDGAGKSREKIKEFTEQVRKMEEKR